MKNPPIQMNQNKQNRMPVQTMRKDSKQTIERNSKQNTKLSIQLIKVQPYSKNSLNKSSQQLSQHSNNSINNNSHSISSSSATRSPQSSIKQIVTSIINLNSYEQLKQQFQLRNKIKDKLINNQDYLTLQLVLQRQIQLIKQQLYNHKDNIITKQQRQHLTIQLSQVLNQLGDNQVRVNKYNEANKAYRESIQLIQQLIHPINKTKGRSSICCLSWLKDIFSNNSNRQSSYSQSKSDQQNIRQSYNSNINVNINSTKNNIRSNDLLLYENIINSSISILRTYNVVDNQKQRILFITKAQSYINQLKTINNLLKQQKQQQQHIQAQQHPLKLSILKIMLMQTQFITQSYLFYNNKPYYDKRISQIASQINYINKNYHNTNELLNIANIYNSIGQIRKAQLKYLIYYCTQQHNYPTFNINQQTIINNHQVQQIMKSLKVQTQNYQLQQNTNNVFNYELKQQLINQAINNFIKALHIYQVNNSQLNYGNNQRCQFNCNNQQIIRIKNNIAQLYIELKQYHKAKQLLNSQLQLLKSKQQSTQYNSQHINSSIILARISYLYGHYKQSFNILNQSFAILKLIVLKQNTPQYQQFLKTSPLLRKIQLLRVNIYNQQQKYPLSFKTLLYLLSIPSNYQDLIKILQLKATTIALIDYQTKNEKKFIHQFQTLIQLINRKQHTNNKNIQIGLIYCSISKCLFKYSQIQKALSYLNKAKQIFDLFPSNHPYVWTYYFLLSYSLLIQAQQINNTNLPQYKQTINQSIHYAQKAITYCIEKYGNQNITLIKIKLHHTRLLDKIHSFTQNNQQLPQTVIKSLQQMQSTLIQMNKQDIKINHYHLLVDSDVQLLLRIVQNQLNHLKKLPQHYQQITLKQHCQSQNQQQHEKVSSGGQTNNNGSDQTQKLSLQTNNKIKQQSSHLSSQLNSISSQKLFTNIIHIKNNEQQQHVQELKINQQ